LTFPSQNNEYINGAIAELPPIISNTPMISMKIITGNNHHNFLSFKNLHKSFKKLISNIFTQYYLPLLPCPPKPLAQEGSCSMLHAPCPLPSEAFGAGGPLTINH
jgi:hypothetical protein